MSSGLSRPRLLVIVRHAESERNAAKRGMVFFENSEAAAPFRGKPDRDTALTESGRNAARALGHRLRDEFGQFDLVIDSGYLRTRLTADLLLEAWDEDERTAIERRTNDLLRERDAGDAENMTAAEASAAFPWLQEYWQETGRYLARPPGGESLADLADRARGFLDQEWSNMAGRRVLLVTHVGTGQMLRMCLEGWPPDAVEERLTSSPIRNCGVVAYEFKPNGTAQALY